MCVLTPSSVEDTIHELRDRWSLARQAAFHKVFNQNKPENEFLMELDQLDESKFEEFLKLVFLHSRNLGVSYQKAKNLVWERRDFLHHSKDLGSECLTGKWEEKNRADVLSREGCPGGKPGRDRRCQYWREAIDGLVAGITDEVGFARNKSLGAGDDHCVDIFFDDESSHTDAIWNHEHKWGELPSGIAAELEVIRQKFDEMRIDLKFLGILERRLFYKMETREKLTCGSAGNIYRGHLEKLIQNVLPDIKLTDASPLAVYGERA